MKRWLPGHLMVWGADGSGYIFDQRVTAKFLRDAGVWPWLTGGEPFERALIHEMVLYDGRKMSKHLGNVVDPMTVVEEWGADALRLEMLLAAAPRKPFSWTDSGVKRSYDFLVRLWRFCETWLEARDPGRPSRTIEESDRLRAQLAKACSTALRRVTEDMDALSMHRAADNAMKLLDKIRQFERRVSDKRGTVEGADREAIEAATELLLEVLAPFVPHICDELWPVAGERATTRPWPADHAVAVPTAEHAA